MEHSDGIEEELTKWVTVAVTAATRATEAIARARAAHAAHEASRQEVAAQAGQRRLAAERETARPLYLPMLDQERFTAATPEHIAQAYGTARAWAQVDDVAQAAQQRLRDLVVQEYGFDPEAAGNELDTALLTAEASREERKRDENQAEATGLLAAAQVADQAAPDTADALAADAGMMWDSAERRDVTARDLRSRVSDAQAVDAVMLSDTAQAVPAADAVMVKRGREKRPAGRGLSGRKQQEIAR